MELLLFADSRDATLKDLRQRAAIEVLSEEPSFFGPVLKVRAPISELPQLAGLAGVQELELCRKRVPANDLSRATLGVATDSVTSSNYLGLTGTNVLVCVNDTGVDASQPDLAGRVFSDSPASGTDTNGHGTHVAGIIAGSGSRSLTVTNAPGSSLPSATLQFRGKAPGASLFATRTAEAGDGYLQQTAARTNAIISNNSWNYANDNEYDLASASYDAAVRDALPGTPGSQSLLFVFAAGNSGAGADAGTGGLADSIQSPGTAKNVITVGAIEDFRTITNETWTCATNGTSGNCQTNVPWLGLTDSSNQVASFSSRGNVGIGVEGEFGRFKPDVVAPGTFLVSTRSGQWDAQAYYSGRTNALSTPPDANYFEVLSNLNRGLGPFYRYESGSSLAAAEVSGMLALMEEFYQTRLGWTNSPALMKALLINGARTLGGGYGLSISSPTNYQGWGLVHLPGSAPAGLIRSASGTNAMWVFDQSPANALVTGQSHTRFVTTSQAARQQPLRVTLAWTDPPGNPVAGLKLVNDLDLLVTNLDTGQVFLGNDIAPGQSFNGPWNTNAAPHQDSANNVENVYLPPTLGTNYSITVMARRVNVNAVTAAADGVRQDYALVVSSGDGQSPNALILTNAFIPGQTPPFVTVVTNTFLSDTNDWGSVLLRQTVGANAPLPDAGTVALAGNTNAVLTIGNTNQWHFYVVTNSTAFTNAVFLTFNSRLLALTSANAATNGGADSPREADIDLYVSQDPQLLSLAPAALATAESSVSRGGTEMIVLSNASANVYYIGVKSETQSAAEYGFVADFSELPFDQDDGLGNRVLRGFPNPLPIPGGSSSNAGVADCFCITPSPLIVQRAIITNILTAPNLGDLTGTLNHRGASVVLNNHSTNGPVVQQTFIYDDSEQEDVPGAVPSDGPGSLRVFGGASGTGPWWLRLSDTNQPAVEQGFSTFLQAQADLTAPFSATLLPGSCREDFIYVPPEAGKLTVAVTLASGDGPVLMQVFPARTPLTNSALLALASAGSNATFVCDNTTQPPLNGGLYEVRLCNQGAAPASVSGLATITPNPNPAPASQFTSSGATPILSDALTTSAVMVTNTGLVGSVAVGVRINHPRVSDLLLKLASPGGTRVVLAENRGGLTSGGMGSNVLITNATPVSYVGGPEGVTNTFDTGQTSGTVMINFDFYALPDDMRVYYDGTLLYDSGLVSNTGATNLQYGPGNSTVITVVMNEGGNTNDNTAWYYKLTSVQSAPSYLTFTENTNLTTTPVKFAAAPFTNFNFSGGSTGSNGLFYLPEESLDKLAGKPAAGLWTLEIFDTRATATVSSPVLLSWQLGLRFQKTVPDPVVAVPGVAATNFLMSGQMQWYAVDAPEWVSFASNTLVTATLPVRLWFNQAASPTGTNAGDVLLFANSTGMTQLLRTNGLPPLLPGRRYYLGVENTNSSPVTVALQVTFNVASMTVLQSGVPFPNSNPGGPGATDYYLYVVSSNAVRVQFEINGPSADMTLLARKGLPLPTLTSYDYHSANPGTNDELIVVYYSSQPVPLTPGEWYLGAVDVTGAAATYSILATEYSSSGTNIVISNPAAHSDSFCFSWSSLAGAHYYIQGKTNLMDAHWTTVSGTLTATDVITSYCVPLSSGCHYFRVQEGLVVSPAPLVLSSIGATPAGVRLNWTGPTNAQFNVQWSAFPGTSNWLAFSNVITGSNGQCSFLDDGSQSAGLSQTRFYRLHELN